MIIEFEINGARVIVSGDNLTVNVTQDDCKAASAPLTFHKNSEPVPFPTPAQIRSLRKSLKMSQAKLAKRIGTTQATVCRWENGEQRPNGPASLVLASLIEVSA